MESHPEDRARGIELISHKSNIDICHLCNLISN